MHLFSRSVCSQLFHSRLKTIWVWFTFLLLIICIHGSIVMLHIHVICKYQADLSVHACVCVCVRANTELHWGEGGPDYVRRSERLANTHPSTESHPRQLAWHSLHSTGWPPHSPTTATMRANQRSLQHLKATVGIWGSGSRVHLQDVTWPKRLNEKWGEQKWEEMEGAMAHLGAEVASVTGAGHVVDVLPTRAESCVHVSHLALHQLTQTTTDNQIETVKVRPTHFIYFLFY